MIPLLMAGGVLAIAAVAVVAVYNSLVQIRQNVDKAWGNIDVLLQQRHDELVKLVEACSGFMKHEDRMLTELTRLRSQFDKAQSIAEKTKTENEMSRQLHGLYYHAEAYPDLKSSQTFLQLQQRISAVEEQLADRREFFNESVNVHNVAIARFPDLLVARGMGLKPHEYLIAPEEARKDMRVDPSTPPA